MMDWTGIRHFNLEEFDSPDVLGSGAMMQERFIQKLDEIRGKCGFAFHVTSGYRTKTHNMDVNGKDSSAHLNGWAADILVRSSLHRFKIIATALQCGVTRIGIGSTFVHLDMDPTKPANTIWTYYY